MKRVNFLLTTVLTIILLALSACGSASPSTTIPASGQTSVSSTSPATTTSLTETTATITPTTATVSPTVTKTAAAFVAASPVSTFTAEDIAFLGLNLSGTPREIADAIRLWQEETWTFVAELSGYEDVSDPIRWNYFLPGIFTSREIIHEQVGDGHIYGICFSFAITYCSVAEYYGLETRVQNSLSRLSDSITDSGPTTGMAPEEYDRLAVKLRERDLNYDYDAVRLVAEETPMHYWAEVKINDEWVIQDATSKINGSDTATVFVQTNDCEVTDWLSRDKSPELNEYQRLIDNGQRLPEPEYTGTDSSPVPPEGYTGMTDDMGQTGRAATIDDLFKGWAYAPYFNDAAEAYAFIQASIPQDFIDDDQALKEQYEAATGEKLYLVALLACSGSDIDTIAECYYDYCGEELDTAVYLELFRD